jgi:glycosyltransferase involved in cell wall biosynthesis
VDGENILIRDDPKAFARAVEAVLDDGALGRRLGERGRATAEQHYSWDVIGRELVETYLNVARVESRSSAAPIALAGSGYAYR